MKRGINSIADVRARCIVDPVTHCWIWQGGKTSQGAPTIHTVDLDRGIKAALRGPRAVWYLAHNEPLHGRLVYRRCRCNDCLCPAHLKTAYTMAEIGLHIARSGTLKGRFLEQRRANQKLAIAAQGIVATAPHIVAAVRAASADTTNDSLAARYGLHKSTVSHIRSGRSHRDLLEAA